MPSGALTLVLEADGIPERCSEVFEVAKQDAAWQEAYERFCSDRPSGSKPWDWWSNERDNSTYIAHGFPGAIRDIVAGTSIVKCDFDVSSACDVDVSALLEQARDSGWALEDWMRKTWQRYGRNTYETQPPLPSWIDLRREDYMEAPDEAQGDDH